jgi:hypothetical protein
MLTTRKRILTITFVVAIALFLLTGTTRVANRTVAWVSDLPNRFHVDGEAMVNAVTGSIRSDLHATDAETQLQMLKLLTDGSTQDPEFLRWMRDLYSDDLQTLTESENADVATNAASLLSMAMVTD